MKTALIAALVSSAIVLPACSTSHLTGVRVGNTPVRSIAMDPGLPGKGVPGQCLPYALALQKKLRASGVNSEIVAYRYEDLVGAGKFARNRKHAAVSFNDEGRTYLMDNVSSEPLWVENSLPVEQQLGQLEGMDARVLAAWNISQGNFRLARKSASERRVMR